jgi:hypothetical protein
MGRSRSSTTSQAARSSRISSFCPTQRTGSSSGCARCSVTPSMAMVRSLAMAEVYLDRGRSGARFARGVI